MAPSPAPRPLRRRTSRGALAATVALVSFPVFPALAATPTAVWTDSTGDWFAPANWSTAAVPTTTVVAEINSGGTAVVASNLTATYSQLRLGATAGGAGSIALSAGTFTRADQYLGYAPSSTGTITQTGGTNRTDENIYLGYAPGSTGIYLLQDGSLASSDLKLSVGYSGTGSISQTGGYTRTDATTLGATPSGTGFYTLAGGTFAPDRLIIATPSSTFTQTGGTLTAGTITQSAGRAQFPDLIVGTNASTYTLTGGTLAASSVLVRGTGSLLVGPTATLTTPSLTVTGGTFSLSSSASLSAASFTVTGGTADLPSDATLDSGTPAFTLPTPPGVPQPSFSHTGGTLALLNGYLGTTPGPATFTQSTPKLAYRFTNFYLASAPASSASYTLADGALTTTTDFIGYAGPASLTQTGGTHTVQTLNLGHDPASTASYTLSGGFLSANSESIGVAGNGTFVQTGGTHFVNALHFGPGGRFELQGGSLSVRSFTYYSGVPFTQTGGTFSFTTFVQSGGSIVAGAPGSLLPDPLLLSGNTFSLAAGTFTASSVNVSFLGTFTYLTQSVINVGSITVEGNGRLQSDTVILDSGSPVIPFNTPPGVPPPTLHLNSGFLGGTFRLGERTTPVTFTQSSPLIFAPSTLRIGDTPGSDATYVLPAGQVIVQSP